ncbi:hypothetical protein BGZ83_005109, partial [Gryganskiella cystojenkinii]
LFALEVNPDMQALVENQAETTSLFVKKYISVIRPKIEQQQDNRNAKRAMEGLDQVTLHIPRSIDFDNAITAFIRLHETEDPHPPKSPQSHERVKAMLRDVLRRQIALSNANDPGDAAAQSHQNLFDTWTNVSLLRLARQRLDQKADGLYWYSSEITGRARQEARATAVRTVIGHIRNLDEKMKADFDYARSFS